MSDVMLHGVLNMPLPDDPAECDFMTWMQFKQRARQASARIEELEAKLAKAEKMLEREIRRVQKIQLDLPPPHTVGLISVEEEYKLMLAELKG